MKRKLFSISLNFLCAFIIVGMTGYGVFAWDTGAWDTRAHEGAWGPSSEVTISLAGVAALPGQGYFTIDTNADDATDDLTQITGLDDGDVILIAPNNDARTVVVKNGANMYLCTGADFTMNNTKDRMVLQHIGANVMVELSRSSGGD